jgi:hypothetical protein
MRGGFMHPDNPANACNHYSSLCDGLKVGGCASYKWEVRLVSLLPPFGRISYSIARHSDGVITGDFFVDG